MIAAALPVGDWQFWCATAVAAVALFFVVRAVAPPAIVPRFLRRRSRGRRATLTVEGKRAR